MSIIKSKALNNILNESIYHVESLYSYDEIDHVIISKEAKNLSETLHKYHYPKKIRNAAINEFYKYFSFKKEEK